MSPAELKDARNKLGLTQSGLATALCMGANGDRTVRRWESGSIPVPGPVEVCIGYMLADTGQLTLDGTLPWQ